VHQLALATVDDLSIYNRKTNRQVNALGFGVRQAFVRDSPLGAVRLYLRQQVTHLAAHVHLVVEPSPGLSKTRMDNGSLAADCPLVHPPDCYFPPFRGGHRVCFHAGLVLEALGDPRSVDMSPFYR
jgi:hypothetical protein